MELWIRSQDKSCLVNIKAVIVLNKEIRGYYNENPNWFLGKYNNEERALEVLDEIQRLITPTINWNPIIKHEIKPEDTYVKTTFEKYEQTIEELSCYVYEMPKE